MPFFAEETLEAVRSIPLHEIVRSRVELSRSGRNWKGLSPFTQEKTPSFFVLTDKNFFKCFSSGLAGDGIRFIQETEKLDFQEAVEALAERFSIPVRFADGGRPNPEMRSLRQNLIDIHEYARDYYHQAFLSDHPVAEHVRRYWTDERGFNLDLAEAFGIGFAPPESRRLLELLLKKGFPLKAIATSGLFHAGRRPGDPEHWFFAFRGRLMIPIRNAQGQVIAFTARQLAQTPRDRDSWKAKYINSPETLLFKKGQLLFNLDRASREVGRAGRFLMVEGQLDALRCWDCGLREAVAPQGTAVTREQMELIRRYTSRIDILLDGDDAGKRAVETILPLAFAAELEVRILPLPNGEDPDDFLRREGRSGLDKVAAVSGIRFVAQSHLGNGDPSPESRARLLRKLYEILSNCPSAVVREGYVEEAIRVSGSSPEAARVDLKRFLQMRQPQRSPSVKMENLPSSGTKSSPLLTNLEADLLWAVSQDVAWIEPLAQVIDHQWIKSDSLEGKLLTRILAQTEVDRIESKDEIQYLLETDEERDCFSRFVVDERPDLNMMDFVNHSLTSLMKRFCRQRISDLEKEIFRLESTASDWSEVIARKREQQTLKQQLLKGPFPEISLSL